MNVLKLDRRLVEVVHQAEERVFVRGALIDGDRVVARGLQRVSPGQRVIEGGVEGLAKN